MSGVVTGEPRSSLAPARSVAVVSQGDLANRLDGILGPIGCAVRSLNGEAAFDSAQPCDLIVLDVDRPAVDAARVLGELNGAGRVPVLVVTTRTDPADLAHWLERGADHVLGAPIEPRLFAATVGACLKALDRTDGATAHLRQLEREKRRYQQLSEVVIPIGIALSAERDFSRLLELILLESMALCNADGGTLYLRTEDDLLTFAITRNASLGIATGGTTGAPNALPPLRLYDEATGQPNHRNVASYTALSRELVNISDAYQPAAFDFSGPRSFDALTGYRSTSFLTCPLVGSDRAVIGVLQLINALDPDTGRVIPFDRYLEQLLTAMASLASFALEAYLREARLRAQLDDLRIEIDQGKKEREVAEITDTGYFQDLVRAVREFRGDTVHAAPARPDGPASA